MMNWKCIFKMAAVLICCAIGTEAIGARAIAELEYYYAKDGTIIGRRVNDNHQAFQYDKRGQLISVVDVKTMKPLEQYAYDPAGNILSKTINGQTTTFIYDKANQLLSSTVDGKTTSYQYDGAGRLVKEGDKTYRYSYLDKLVEVMENGEQTASFDYHINGQIASVRRTAKLPAQASGAGEEVENFLWDGLALIHRGNTNYINEPHVTGGNPILADDKVLFNDMLGTTLGVKSGEQFNSITRDAFGQTADQSKDQFFTGKPYIGELGYAFLFRNYRADQGKWQTQDPIGYPDGWNNFAYVNNGVTDSIDWLGASTLVASGSFDAAALFISKYTPSDPNWSAWKSGNSQVSYQIFADITKNKNGITVANVRAVVDSGPFSISYGIDLDEDGNLSAEETKLAISGIKGTATAGASSTVTFKKNPDGSTTYTLDMTITVTETVNASLGTYNQIKTYTFKDTHIVPE